MNTAEIKLDLFRKIDNLSGTELKKIYKAFLTLLPPSEKYTLAKEEGKAVEDALECSKRSETFPHESVIKEAQTRNPQLRFK